MAGVRKKANLKGRFQGWYIDSAGKQRFFLGTRNKAETLRMAERLEDEHRQVRLGYRPAPLSADKHRKRPFLEVMEEYCLGGSLKVAEAEGRGAEPMPVCAVAIWRAGRSA